jgi:hypothetical protein
MEEKLVVHLCVALASERSAGKPLNQVVQASTIYKHYVALALETPDVNPSI